MLALPDVRDGLRARRQLAVRAITPVVLFVAVLGVSLLTGGSDGATGRDRWTVGVEGDLAGARATLDELGGSRLTFVPVQDASLVALDDADAAVRVPEDLDALVATGSPVVLDLVEVTLDADSRAAVAQLQAALTVRAATEARRAVGIEPSDSVFTVDLTEVELEQRGTRVLGAELVSAVVCLTAAMLVSGAASRFRGRRGAGSLVAQLALPVTRRRLALAKGQAELVVGGVALLPVLVPTVLLAAATVARSGGGLAALAVIPVVLACAAALGACTTAIGVLVGVVARTQEQVTLGSGAAVVSAAVVAATVGLGDLPRPTALALVPLAGVVSELRAAVGGDADPLAMVVALGVTVAAAVGVSAASGRALDGERLVLREA